MYPRFVGGTVKEIMAFMPATVIQGARQVGKSTLAQLIAETTPSKIISLDDPIMRSEAMNDLAGFAGAYPEGLLVIDETQRVPELIVPIKANIDKDRRPKRFLLTGSADLLQVKGVGDSLAGRAISIELMPLSQGEIARRSTPEDFVTWILGDAENTQFDALGEQTIIKGGYPDVLSLSARQKHMWFDSYIARLADHDARELRSRGYADQFADLLTYIAASGQSEIIKATLAKHLGIDQGTADAYLRLARTMRLTYQLQPWNQQPLRRVTRRSKTCLIDTGLAAALTHFTEAKAKELGAREYYGSLVEQFAVLELAKQQTWTKKPFHLYHFRNLDGLEVDIVIETDDGDLLAIEVKATTTPIGRHWKNLVTFKKLFPDRDITGILLHTGTFATTLNGWLHVLPITSLWQH